MLLNSIGLIREYTLLIKYRVTNKRFWIERLIGIVCSVIIASYSIIALAFLANNLYGNIMFGLNIIFSILFLYAGVISTIEGILYVKADFCNNVIDDNITVAIGIAIDV